MEIYIKEMLKKIHQEAYDQIFGLGDDNGVSPDEIAKALNEFERVYTQSLKDFMEKMKNVDCKLCSNIDLFKI